MLGHRYVLASLNSPFENLYLKLQLTKLPVFLDTPVICPSSYFKPIEFHAMENVFILKLIITLGLCVKPALCTLVETGHLERQSYCFEPRTEKLSGFSASPFQQPQRRRKAELSRFVFSTAYIWKKLTHQVAFNNCGYCNCTLSVPALQHIYSCLYHPKVP